METIPVIVVLKENVNIDKVHETLQTLGLQATFVLYSVKIITGVVHSNSTLKALMEVEGVDSISKADEKQCCGGSCGCE